MRYTEDIHEALQKAVRKYGTRAAVARRIGIHEAIIGRYLNRRHDFMSETNSERVMAFLTSEGYKPNMQGPTMQQPAIPNTPSLRSFIQDAMIERSRKYPELARACTMQPDTLRRLLKGELQQWFPGNLAKLLNELALSVDEAPLAPGEKSLLHPGFSDGGLPTRPCWVLTMAQAATVHDIHEAFEPDSAWNAEVVPVAEARDCIGFKVQGHSMAPRIVEGDIVICDRNASPVNRKPAVAKVNGRVVCKIYRRISDAIYLESINPDGQDYDDLHPGELEWVLPVIKLERTI